MQSSFKIIKNNRVNTLGEKEIITKEIEVFSDEPFKAGEGKSPEVILEYQKLKLKSDEMLKNAKHKAEEIIKIANNRAVEIDKEVRKKGYKEGTKKGYEDGYNLGIEEATIEKEKIIAAEKERILETEEELNKLLLSAKKEYEKYLEDKTIDIKNLIYKITEKIIKKEFSNPEIIENILSETIKDSRGSKTIIVKCCEKQANFIKEHIEELKTQLTFKTEVFVITDPFINEGNILIEKADGKVAFGYEIAKQKLEEILTN